jgi:hypothetical protein
MPDPSCRTCRHWKPIMGLGDEERPTPDTAQEGVCERVVPISWKKPYDRTAFIQVKDPDNCGLICKPDFGCRLWEPGDG